MNPTALVTANVRLRNSDSGRIGSGTRDSTNTNAVSATTASTINAMIRVEFHGHVVPPRLVKRTIADKPAGEQRRAEVVDLVLLRHRARAEGGADHDERDRTDRQVDVEDPPPREVVDEEPAEQRPDDGRDAEDGAEDALVAAAVARRDDVADDGDRGHDQAAGAEALQAPGTPISSAMFCAQPAQRRADEEDHDRGLQDDLAPVEIAELSVERSRHRRRRAGTRSRPRRGAGARRGRRRSSAAPSRRSSGRATRAGRRG